MKNNLQNYKTFHIFAKNYVMVNFELCANGYQSMINGVVGCADCAELCEALEVGGVTPSEETLFNCQNAARHLPVRVLIRCRDGNFVYNEKEIDTMCDSIRKVKSLGYEGVVIGALNADGEIDIPAIKKMKKAGEGMKLTFHRAIDRCKNPVETVEKLVSLGFDKVLTSGGKPTAYEGIPVIREMQKRYGDKIKIMAGGGITEENIEQILSATGIDNCHASLTSQKDYLPHKLYHKEYDHNKVPTSMKVSDVNRIKDIVESIK